jgi:mxaA protein
MRFINHRYVYLCCVAVCFLTSLASSSYAAEQSADDISVRSEMREVAYSVGDVATQTIIVDIPKGFRFEPSSLPTIGKTSDFIELRDVKWQFEDTKNSTRYVFVLDWQIFQVLQEVRAYPLRQLNLQFRLDDKLIHVKPEPHHVIVSTVLPTTLKPERLKNLPDIEAKPRPTLKLKWSLFVSLLTLLASIAYFSWYFDWLQLRSKSSRPFRVACREMRVIRKSRNSDQERLLAAMKTLRRAGDVSAGFALSKERLDLLFEQNPWLSPLRSDIEKFYYDSERLFFAGAPNAMDLQQLYKLGLKLRALESAAG